MPLQPTGGMLHVLRETPTKRLCSGLARETRLIDASPEMKIGYLLISTKPEDNFSDFIKSGLIFANRKIALEIQNHLHETSSVIAKGRRQSY